MLNKRIEAIARFMLSGVIATTCLYGCATSGNQGSQNTAVQGENSASESEGNDPAKEATFVIATQYGDLAYPVQWQDQLETEQTETKDGVKVDFFTSVGKTRYQLFSVIIGDEENLVGSIRDANGTVRNVSVAMADLGDISALRQADQDQLYAMQEGLNVVVENLD